MIEINEELSELDKQALARKERINQLKRKRQRDNESANKTGNVLPKWVQLKIFNCFIPTINVISFIGLNSEVINQNTKS